MSMTGFAVLGGLWLRLAVEQVADQLPVGRQHPRFRVLLDPMEVPDAPVELVKRLLSCLSVALHVLGLTLAAHLGPSTRSDIRAQTLPPDRRLNRKGTGLPPEFLPTR